MSRELIALLVSLPADRPFHAPSVQGADPTAWDVAIAEGYIVPTDRLEWFALSSTGKVTRSFLRRTSRITS